MSGKAVLSWSGGKDCALALQTTLRNPNLRVVSLLTTLSETDGRVSMHGVRNDLLQAQTAALGLPLDPIFVPENCSDQEYQSLMGAAMRRYQEQGINQVVFGDIFLEDLRAYRQENLAKIGMQALFPLWGQGSAELAQTFLEAGFQATLTSIDLEVMPWNSCGRSFDESFLADLPAGVDPCGENGEFHTFVHAGPIFKEPLQCLRGPVTTQDGRYFYCDLVLGDNRGPVTGASSQARLSSLKSAYNRAVEERQAKETAQWKNTLRENFLERLQKEAKTRLLEVGAGVGRDSRYFQDHGLQVVATDLSPGNVRACRAKGLMAYEMDFLSLRFAPESFEALYAFNCLLHIPREEFSLVLQAFHGLLKPEGLFFLGQYGGRDSAGVYPDDHYQPQRYFSFFSDSAIQDAVETYFQIESFDRIPQEGDLHFQALTLRKVTAPPADANSLVGVRSLA